MFSLYLRGVNTVVLGVGSHESHKAQPIPIVKSHDQSIAVSSNVKDDSLIPNDARISICCFYICWRGPICGCRDHIPSSQRLFGMWLLFPERSQGSFGNNTHSARIIIPQRDVKRQSCPTRDDASAKGGESKAKCSDAALQWAEDR